MKGLFHPKPKGSKDREEKGLRIGGKQTHKRCLSKELAGQFGCSAQWEANVVDTNFVSEAQLVLKGPIPPYEVNPQYIYIYIVRVPHVKKLHFNFFHKLFALALLLETKELYCNKLHNHVIIVGMEQESHSRSSVSLLCFFFLFV